MRKGVEYGKDRVAASGGRLQNIEQTFSGFWLGNSLHYHACKESNAMFLEKL